jgi:uncharacterized repeat protein (TIGR01451 family)
MEISPNPFRRIRISFRAFIVLVLAAAASIRPDTAAAWPAAGQWIPVYKNSAPLQDSVSDANGSRNVVADSSHPAAYMFNDGTYVHFRLRLDKNPAGTGGQGLLEPYGWGVALDTDSNSGNYEWLIMVDGVSQAESVGLWRNTVQGTLGNPSDSPEVLTSSVSASGNIQISAADSALNGDTDYFLDWRLPFNTLKQAAGIDDSAPVKLFFGTSNSANSLATDLVGGSDLYTGFSDVITAVGTKPATGTVRFVADLTGAGDVAQVRAGDTLFIRVDDTDVNSDNVSRQTVQVILTAGGGDTSALTLLETGVNTGVFTASIPTAEAAPVSGDGVLQVKPGDIVTVDYIDGIDGMLSRNQIRADSIYVISLKPLINLVKNADHPSVTPGAEVVYSIYYRNIGVGAASNLTLLDTVPVNTTYVTGSMRIGSASSTYAAAAALTDGNDGDAGMVSGSNVIFTIQTVQGDDGVSGSGGDEGKVYFRIRIN